MPRAVLYEEVRELLQAGAQLVDVLPHERYREQHLPGAINIPLKELKVDWLARGLPMEGEKAGKAVVWNILRQDVVTASLHTRMADVRERVAPSPYGFALVLTEGGTLFGRLRKASLQEHPEALAEDVMEPGRRRCGPT